MSFDPHCIAAFRELSPSLPRGLVAERFDDPDYWSQLSFSQRFAMRNLLTSTFARPHFIAYDVRALPAIAPLAAQNVFGLPLLTWTVRTKEDQDRALRYADAMIFEGIRPWARGDMESPWRETEMEASGKAAVVRVASRIAQVTAAEWDACAGGLSTRADNPFICHAFFWALEESGSATRNTGWLPQHLLLEDESGQLAGCMPCYLKSHSLGEYVFDHGWADAYERAGGRYYPKLQASIPFTPV